MVYLNNTKQKIIEVAWSMFREKGFEKTTIDDILKGANISKGTFYHYFTSKDALLSTLADLFDKFYLELRDDLDPEMNSVDKLIYICVSCHRFIEQLVDFELLTTLYSSQVRLNGDRHLLDNTRYNYLLVRDIIAEGQRRNEIISDIPAYKIEHFFMMCTRAIVYDYCIYEASYSLPEYTQEVLPNMLQWIRSL